MRLTVCRVSAIAAVVCLLLLLALELSPRQSRLRIELRRMPLDKTVALLNGWPCSLDSLVDAIETRLAGVCTYTDDLGTHHDIEIVISGSPETGFGAFRPVFEACRESGVHKVTLVSREYSAPLLLFNSRDLRGGVGRTPSACVHPPRIKLLWVQKDSLKETDSPDGRFVLKIKDIVLEKKAKKQGAPDFDSLARYLSTMRKHFQPLRSYPVLTAGIDAHWNVPFGTVVRCASVAKEAGITECCLADLPWKCSDRKWEDMGTLKVEKKWERYDKQVERIRRKQDSRE